VDWVLVVASLAVQLAPLTTVKSSCCSKASIKLLPPAVPSRAAGRCQRAVVDFTLAMLKSPSIRRAASFSVASFAMPPSSEVKTSGL
jgi:hypothetical protein